MKKNSMPLKILIILIGLWTWMECLARTSEEQKTRGRRSYEKLLKVPRLLFKDKRRKELEVLAAYMVQNIIKQARDMNDLGANLTISKQLESLITEILTSREANENDVLQAKEVALKEVKEKIVEDLLRAYRLEIQQVKKINTIRMGKLPF